MNIFNRNMLSRFNRPAMLLSGVLLLCNGLPAHADDIEDASQLFKQGQRSEALAKVNDYLAEKPKDAQARFLKGLILTEHGKVVIGLRQIGIVIGQRRKYFDGFGGLALLGEDQSF